VAGGPRGVMRYDAADLQPMVGGCNLTPGSPQVHPKLTPGSQQVDPRLTPGCTQVDRAWNHRSKLQYDGLLSSFAFNFNLLR
jgi:hypothetical protein